MIAFLSSVITFLFSMTGATLLMAAATLGLAVAAFRQLRLLGEQSGAMRQQLEVSRFSVGFSSLLRLEEQWDSAQVRAVRREAAAKLLQDQAHVVEQKGVPSVDQVLDTFDTAGYLVAKGVLSPEDVYHMFYDPLVCYWAAAEIYVGEVDQAGDATVWKHLKALVPKLLELKAKDEGVTVQEVKPEPETWRAFLEEEWTYHLP